MHKLHAFEVLAPLFQAGMLKRHRVNFVLLHNRMRTFCYTVRIKFFFEQVVYRAIKRERISGRPRHTEFVVNIKTTRAFTEEVDF